MGRLTDKKDIDRQVNSALEDILGGISAERFIKELDGITNPPEEEEDKWASYLPKEENEESPKTEEVSDPE